MLSGDNSILRRAKQATGYNYIGSAKDEVSLAYNSAYAEYLTNRYTEGKTEDDKNLAKVFAKELKKGVAANGGTSHNCKIIYNESGVTTVTVEYTDDQGTKYTAIGTLNATVGKEEFTWGGVTTGATTHGEGGGQDDNKIQLHVTDVATESRAAIIEVTVSGVPTMEEWLTGYRTTNETEFNEMFAKAYSGPTATWANVSQNGTKTVDELYTQGPGNSSSFNNIYDYIIKRGYAEETYNSTYAKTTLTCNGETITGVEGEFLVTKNGSYTISAVHGEESRTTTIEVDKCKVEEYSEIQNSNNPIEQGDYTAIIPAGFAYGISENVGTIEKGLVITDSVEEVGGKKYSNGNEFVWIPVDKANLTVGKTDRKMAQISSGTDYRGVLYNWSSDNTGATQITYRSSGYREPDVVSNYDGGSSDTVGITLTGENGLQKQYNDMIASIQEYGGFYVARYELGKDAISKLAVEPTSAAENNTKTWYGLYSKAKSYSNSKNSVTAQMIWGSQYDAMLQFGLTNSDSSKVNATTNGNHTGKVLKTGTHKGADSINNIFDLEGNMWEWTQEAYDSYNRIHRGGYFDDYTASPSALISNRFPRGASPNSSSRSSLFIKK